ncbi:MAG: hypothetical protein JSW55_03765 [Chloroflexota bacterium]|nr:MAG: hypothetical protein JSW55_03765 [Chloroflexota bacterium]
MKFTGSIEPEDSGRQIASHVLNTTGADTVGKFTKNGKGIKISKRIVNGSQEYDRLIAFSEEITAIKVSDYLKMELEKTK